MKVFEDCVVELEMFLKNEGDCNVLWDYWVVFEGFEEDSEGF